MARSRWFCTSSTKNMLVKIIHPGGHVELHDRPILAAEIMLRNPKCCVAHPNVFKQPSAVVAPDTTLMLGQKFYVVPISTIRKLQRLSPNHSPSPSSSSSTPSSSAVHEFMAADSRKRGQMEEDEGKECFSKDNCFGGLLGGMRLKGESGNYPSFEESTSVGNGNCGRVPGTRELIRRNRARRGARRGARGPSPKRRWSSENWQPSLDSITEE